MLLFSPSFLVEPPMCLSYKSLIMFHFIIEFHIMSWFSLALCSVVLSQISPVIPNTVCLTFQKCGFLFFVFPWPAFLDWVLLFLGRKDLEKRNFGMPGLRFCDLRISSALRTNERLHTLTCGLPGALWSRLPVGPLLACHWWLFKPRPGWLPELYL